MDPNHILLSCTCDFTQSPPFFHAEIMPVETPQYVKGSELSDNDLYFLRWVFEDHFDLLTNYIELNLPQYKIHIARPESGVSWSSYRNKERGFLVWLVKSKEFQDPLSSLKSALLFYKAQEERRLKEKEDLTTAVAAAVAANVTTSVTGNDADKDSDDEKTIASTPITDLEQEMIDVPKLVAEQLTLVRNNIKKYYQEMEEIESLVNQIWTADDTKSVNKTEQNVEDSMVNTGSEWCVVDDTQFQDVLSIKPKKGLLQKVSEKATKIALQ